MDANEVAHKWFDALKSGDTDTAMSLLDENVTWINMAPEPGVSDVLPWIGSYQGLEKFLKAFGVYQSVVDVKFIEPTNLIVEGNQAFAMVHEIGEVKHNGRQFDIEFGLLMKIENGKIVWWKSLTDSSHIVAAWLGM